MQFLRVLNYIIRHPFNSGYQSKAIWSFLKWQLNCRLNPFPIIYPFTEHAKLIIKKGLTGATGNIYCGLHEFEDMSFLLHFLRPGDLFLDVGANIGSYTILASAEVGANSISIEPIPATYQLLLNNIQINGISPLVTTMNIGLGNEKSVLRFTSDLDTVNHVVKDELPGTIDVEVMTLDSILHDDIPKLIKIDVEGFEAEVLKGGEETLKNTNLLALIVELNGSGDRYGYDEKLVHSKLLTYGFQPFEYEPFSRTLRKIPVSGGHNTLYLRSPEKVMQIVAEARRFKIQGREI